MKSKIICLVVIFFNSCGINGIYYKTEEKTDSNEFNANQLQHRLILIGDAGDPIEKLPVYNYEAIKSLISQSPEKHLTLFLGDNVYPLGLPDKTDSNYPKYKNVIDQQLEIAVSTNSAAVMIPGNHDWAKGNEIGFAQIKRQSEYVDQFNRKYVQFQPKLGSIEPVLIDTLGFQVLVIDSHQWIKSLNEGISPKQFENYLNKIKLNDKPLIVAAHHPLLTGGPHGGFFTWKQHLFPLTEFDSSYILPLPLIGSLYPLIRSMGISYQDLSAPAYQTYIRLMKRYIELHPVLIYAAGHEHALEVFDHDTYYSIVSGTGRETGLSEIKESEQMLFGSEQAGFVTIDIKLNGSTYLNVWHSDSSFKANLVYSLRVK